MNLFQLASRGIDLDALPDESAPEREPLAFEPSPAGSRFAVPQEFDAAFQAAGDEYGVDPDVLRAMAFAESRFRPDVISGQVKSRTGAAGLMQFMPGTAERFGINPLDPVESIFGAAAYMRANLEKFDGDYGKAVAAYNWGENRKAYDAEDWQSLAPKETQGYLKTVFGAADELKLRAPQASTEAAPAAKVGGKASPELTPGEAAPFFSADRAKDTALGIAGLIPGMGGSAAKPTGYAGVLAGAQAVSDLPSTSKAPVSKEARKAVEDAWDAATPEQRSALESKDGWVGQLARERAGVFERADAGAFQSPVAKKLDPRVESRKERLAMAGENPAFAERAAIEGAQRGVAPGDEVRALGGTVQPSKFDFDTKQAFDPKQPVNGLNNPIVRGLAKGGLGAAKAVAGYGQFLSDVYGLDNAALASRGAGDSLRSKEDAIGESGTVLERNLEGAIASIAQQLPLMATGSEAISLAGIGLQSFGQEYSDGRSKGQTIEQATQRASAFAAFEVLGEKFGIKGNLSAIKSLTHGKTDEAVMGFLSNTLKREIPGELLTTTGQFATDKLGPDGVALNPKSTVDDYLHQVRDTIVQTVMQGGITSGGSKAIGSTMSAAAKVRQDRINNDPSKALAQALDEGQFSPAGVSASVADALRTERVNGAGINPAATVAPKVEDQPTVPTAPVVPPQGLQQAPGPVPAAPTPSDSQSIAQQILEAEAAQPQATGLAAELEVLRARSAPAPDFTQQSATPQAQPGSVPVTGGLAAELQALRARSSPQEAANAPQRTPSDTQQQTKATSAQAADVAGVNAPAPAADVPGAGVAATQATGVDISTTQGAPANVPQPAQPGTQAAPAPGAQGEAQAAQAGVAPRPKNWRTSMLGATPVAKAMGIDTKGKRLAQVVAEIDARDTQAPATPAPAPTPGPTRLGRDNTPLSEGGKPFKTRKAAGDAKKLQPMMRVVTVPGGYALAEKTPAQLAAEERAAKRLRTPRTSPAGEPAPAHAFIAASGGLHMRHRNDLGVDGNPRIGNRRLFGGLNRGLSIEQATEMLVADGYLSEGASHNDAYALIKKSLSQPQYNADGIERIAQAESDAQFEDYMAAQEEMAQEGDGFDPFDMAGEFTSEELDDVGYASASPALQAEVNALIAQADAMDIDTYAILEDIARTYANATQDQYNAAAREAIAAAIARGNSDGGSTAAQAAPAAEPAAAQGLNRPSALTSQAQVATENVAPPALELAAQTPAEAAARQDAQEQADKAEAAAKRAEDAAAKAEEERKRIAQASVRAADSFELGQDPMDSLTGQGGLRFSRAPAGGQTGQEGLMFSRTGAQSSNAQQPTSRAWYDRFVSLLPASYRNDPHRREPFPAEDWNVQRASEVRSKVEALNKQLRGADDRKGYGPVSVDGLGNLQVDARDVSAADLTGGIMALANELGAGIAATNVRSADARALQNSGFVSESSLAAIADRLMGRPFAQPVNTYAKDFAPGAILTYKPRGFPAVLFSFAGARAATADRHALVTAQDRLSAGEDAETVRQETGWFHGKDGKWRYEISDAGAQLAQQVYFAERGKWYPSRFLADARDHGSDTGGTGTLGDVLEHPALFAAYPALRDMPVTAKIRKDQESGAFDGRSITATAENEGRLLSVLLHEIQHGIQNIEGFATGGSIESARAMQADAQSNAFNKAQGAWYESRKRWPSAYKSLMDQRMLDGRLYDKYDIKTMDEDGNQRKAIVLAFELRKKISEADKALRSQAQLAYNDAVESELGGFGSDAFNEFNGLYSAVTKAFEGTAETATSVYKRLAGEVEARNTQARQGMTDEQRRATPPSQTADVADSEVIVMFNGKVMANAPMPANAAPDAATTAQPLRTSAATIRAAITKAYGKLLGQLESKGLVTLTQTEDEAIEAAAQARAAKTGQSVERERATLRASVKNSVADQTQTENFQRWFKDSKVVDSDGKPMVVYHGTAADFDAFDNLKTGANDMGLWGRGHYFASSPTSANSYALRQGDGARVIPAHVSIQNPLVLRTGRDLVTRLPDGTDTRELIGKNLDGAKIKAIAMDGGHDGVIQIKPDGSIGDVVAFRPEQIKSATGNRGTFGSKPSAFDGNVDSFSAEVLSDGLAADADFLRNFASTRTFKKFGLDGFDIPSNGLVFKRVSSVLQDFKIRDAVIKLIPVDVMNILISQKLSPDVLLNDVSVLSDLLSTDSDNPVTLVIGESTKVARAIAGVTAKYLASNSDLRVLPTDRNSAMGTQARQSDALVDGITGVRAKNPSALRNTRSKAADDGRAIGAVKGFHDGLQSGEYSIAYNADSRLSTIENFDPANPDIRRSADGSIQGFFDPQTGQSFLIADNLTAEAAPGVLMHEVGIHMAADGSMKALFNRAAMMLKLQRGNHFMKAVQDRMDAAGETSGEEAAAYIAEAYENDRANAPASVQRWLADLLAAVKAWMFKKGIMGADRLTVADIAAVARANAKSLARGDAAGGVKFSRAPALDKNIPAFGDIRKPRESVSDVANGLSNATKVLGNRTVLMDSVVGAMSAAADDMARANDLASKLMQPDAFFERVILDDAGNVIEGQHRVTALRILGVKAIPAVVIKDYMRDFDSIAVGDAIRNAQKMGSDQSNQLVGMLAEIYADENGDMAEVVQYESPRGYEKAWQAGIDELSKGGTGLDVKRSATGNNGQFDHANPDIRFSRTQTPIPASAQASLFATPPWQLPEATRTDKLIYELQDGRIDLKRVQEAIAATGKQITEGFDARLAETLMPGRIARRTESFLSAEVKPLLESMAKNNVSQDELSDYLLARHAPERNAQIAKVNDEMPDGGAGTNSQGVLMTTQAARDHIAALTQGKRLVLELLAKRVDELTLGTREVLVREGLEKQETVDAWTGAYKHYVPLFKDEAMETPGHPIGAGVSVTGTASRRATGSTGEVTNMLAHILMQREAAITRAEKNRVAMSLYGLALTNPNAEMWTTIRPSMPSDQIANELVRMGVDPLEAEVGMQGVPTIRGVDPVSGKVVDRPNPMYKRLDNSLVVKVNGEDRVILFNASNERAVRLVRNLKNQDGVLGQLDLAGSIVGKATRYFASINTQYNPAFGMVNIVRDVGGAMVNLTDTALAGKQARVLSDSIPAMIGIARDLRGDAQRTPWSDLWQQFQDDGGRTGYRDLFIDPYKRADAVQSELDKLGKDGKLTPGAAAHAVLDLLDDFNTTLENGVRLAAYKAALDKGMSRAESARLARELTLDFNRKGRAGREIGPLFAFFNASVQGTARTLKALQGPAGKRILVGGLSLGVIQALLLSMAGYEDDEIPEFVKARAFIIPLAGKQYITIPLQFGLNALPNTGRVVTELLMSGGKDWGEKSFNALGELAGSFNPLGGGNIFTGAGALKTISPTVIDPIVDMATNTDFTGKPIGKERMPWDTRPGFTMGREGTQRSFTGQAYIGISKAINSLTGGNDFAQGLASPSPEEVRYVFTTVGGGVFRELEKILNASVLTAQGEDLKAREVPLGSRFAGEVEDQDLQRSRFFKNSSKIEKLEAQLKGLSKEGRGDEVRKLIDDNPLVKLYELNDEVRSNVTKLNKLASESINDKEALKRIDAARTTYMRALNDKVLEMENAGR